MTLHDMDRFILGLVIVGLIIIGLFKIVKTKFNKSESNKSDTVLIKAKEELKEASNGIKVLGGRVDEVIDFTLTNDDHRSNIIIKKVKATPGKYPRMFSKIKKQPL